MLQKCILLAVGGFFLYLSRTFTAEVSWTTNVQSLVIVLGGSLIASLLAFPVSTLRDLARSLSAMRGENGEDLERRVQQIVALSRVSRLHGTKAMERECRKIGDPLLSLGVELIVDRFERYEIREILEKETEFHASKLESQQAVLNTLVKLAPAFGFVGTIIGLINVLGTMSSPMEMGKAVSLALLTTFYGLLVSNIIFLPLSKKFSEYAKRRRSEMAVLVEGILGIADQENSTGIQTRLNYFFVRRHARELSESGKEQGKRFWIKKVQSRRQNA